MKKTAPLDIIKIHNPATNRLESPLLTMEIDPYSRCILSAKLSFSSDKNVEENKETPT